MADLQFQQESFTALRCELEPLFERHWQEVKSVQPLDPNWPLYSTLEGAGMYAFTTARAAGTLVGYAGFAVSPSLHSQSQVCAESDLLWLDVGMRRGLAGARLLRSAEGYLASIGVRMIVVTTTIVCDIGLLLRWMGYAEIERSYAKVVG